MGRFTDIGELDMAPVANEQLDAVSLLQFFNLSRQGRLGNMQKFGSPGKTGVCGYRMERSQMRVRYWHNLFKAFVISI
jgi:hypothetical protein